MIANLRTGRTRLITACVAVIAFIQAMTVAPAWACEGDHQSPVAATTSPMEHTNGDSDCPEPSSQSPMQHSTDCQLSCVSMAGCGTPALVGEQALVGFTEPESNNPLTLVEAYQSRSLAPDRPPPRS
jgi:hypothetical protein